MLTIFILGLIQLFSKMVSTREEKNQQKKRQIGQLKVAWNDFNLRDGTNVSVMENETLEQQTNGQHNVLERDFLRVQVKTRSWKKCWRQN